MEDLNGDINYENLESEDLEKTIEIEPITDRKYLEDTLTDFNLDNNNE